MDLTEDQIRNWKMETRDCIEYKRKYQKEEKWNPNAKQYAEAIQMFSYLSKRCCRGMERENNRKFSDLKKASM